MQSITKQWLQFILASISFITVWYFLFLVFDDYALYFGWFFASICAYLTYHISAFLSDF